MTKFTEEHGRGGRVGGACLHSESPRPASKQLAIPTGPYQLSLQQRADMGPVRQRSALRREVTGQGWEKNWVRPGRTGPYVRPHLD
jgi:hypothetical protein